jgi:hypothetical protein
VRYWSRRCSSTWGREPRPNSLAGGCREADQPRARIVRGGQLALLRGCREGGCSSARNLRGGQLARRGGLPRNRPSPRPDRTRRPTRPTRGAYQEISIAERSGTSCAGRAHVRFGPSIEISCRPSAFVELTPPRSSRRSGAPGFIPRGCRSFAITNFARNRMSAPASASVSQRRSTEHRSQPTQSTNDTDRDGPRTQPRPKCRPARKGGPREAGGNRRVSPIDSPQG